MLKCVIGLGGLRIRLSVQCLITRRKLADDEVELVFEDLVLLGLLFVGLLQIGKLLSDGFDACIEGGRFGLRHLFEEFGDVVGQAGVWGEAQPPKVLGLQA